MNLQSFYGWNLHRNLYIAIAFGIALTGCFTNNPRQSKGDTHMERDIHSFARPQEVVMKHLILDLRVDFQNRQIIGKASAYIQNKSGATDLYLDTRDLIIERATLGDKEMNGKFRLGLPVKYLGRPLIISIEPQTEVVHIYYKTKPNAAALQWLKPRQTADGKSPFLFTQSQAILARTWIPCQDSPGIRFTYHARVKTEPGLMVLMSARNPTLKTKKGEYEFEMQQPIPAYLLALAIGDLKFHSLGSRTGVYAEPSLIRKAAWEFAETERMMTVAESLYGPYRWTRYDILVLPPSFPFGGMENPRLTFATPTILSGDRSLVSLIAHELAHSWSGNLVTNANWNDFWLNEGFTTYFEHRIMEALYGKEYEAMLAYLDNQDLIATIKRLGEKNPDTRLHLNLADRDPDEGMTDIAYIKGFFFLRMLEENIGREKWDTFLRDYFQEFAFQSMTSTVFLNYLRKKLIEDDGSFEQKLKLAEWIYGAGLPGNCPRVYSREFEKVEEQVQAWINGTPAKHLQTDNWTTHHWRHFLRKLPDHMTRQQMKELDQAFGFTQTGNSEILNAWLLHVITNKYERAYPALEGFLIHQGRRKFLRPIYQKLSETQDGLKMARQIYKKARPTYHSISYRTIDEILDWQKYSSTD